MYMSEALCEPTHTQQKRGGTHNAPLNKALKSELNIATQNKNNRETRVNWHMCFVYNIFTDSLAETVSHKILNVQQSTGGEKWKRNLTKWCVNGNSKCPKQRLKTD